MRLKRATTMDRYRGEDLGLSREERQERRELRRSRRQERREARRLDRREERLARKAAQLREKAERLEEKAAQPTRRQQRQERRSERRSERRADEAQQGYPRPGYPASWAPDGYPDDGSLPPDEDAPPMEPGEVELEPAPDGTEGLGWTWPRRRSRQAQHLALPGPTTPPAGPSAAPAAPGRAAPQLPAPWSPPARMGSHLRIQASAGYRAAIVELKPGLFVVAEIPAELARSELGFAPLLAPLVVRAASRAAARREAQAQPQGQGQAPLYVQQPDGSFAPAQPAAQPERRGLLSMFRRQEAPAQPGPVEPEPVAGPLVIAVPRVARWADPEDLAGLLAAPSFRGRR